VGLSWVYFARSFPLFTGTILGEGYPVSVTTLYSAKGLEAEYVFCPWLNREYMPMANRDSEEERRVLYVALTRAKQDVILLFHEKYDGKRRRLIKQESMSPFLAEIIEHLELKRIRTGDVKKRI
jgi:superfamily I DNA/RNA helicase